MGICDFETDHDKNACLAAVGEILISLPRLATRPAVIRKHAQRHD
jgi:hypothetical protein